MAHLICPHAQSLIFMKIQATGIKRSASTRAPIKKGIIATKAIINGIATTALSILSSTFMVHVRRLLGVLYTVALIHLWKQLQEFCPSIFRGHANLR